MTFLVLLVLLLAVATLAVVTHALAGLATMPPSERCAVLASGPGGVLRAAAAGLALSGRCQPGPPDLQPHTRTGAVPRELR